MKLVESSFSRIAEVVHELGIPGVDGVLADLGVSSMQLDQAARGFSFREAGPLDMRMDAGDELTADEIVNRWSEKEIADTLYQGAEEHDSRRIARAIVRARPIRDTAHLATVVAGARKQWGRQRLHPATKTFLALRIAVNREMEALGQFLSRTPATLNSGGRLVVLSYHSGEDRLVKRRVSRGRASGDAQGADQTRDPAERGRDFGEPTIAKCETAVRGKSVRMKSRKKKAGRNAVSHRKANRQFEAGAERRAGAITQASIARRGWALIVAVFFMMYIYQHFRCIDLSFQLEDLKAKQIAVGALNSELRLEIEALRDPRRIDVIARRQLGLTQPLPTQVQEYDAPSGAEVAAAGYARANHD